MHCLRNAHRPDVPWPATVALIGALAGCAAIAPGPRFGLDGIPPAHGYCSAAERLVTRTTIPVTVEIQRTFAAFVKSKALIEGPTIQEYLWTDSTGALIAISCKMKSADHLVAAFGPDSAGPDGTCQDMNRAVYDLVRREVPRPAYATVVFDPAETVSNGREPAMTGPDWLAPYAITSVDAAGALHVIAKGFIVDFNDPRFAAMPARFRGVHYCHFIAPDHLRALLEGRAAPGAIVGREVTTGSAPAPVR